MTSKHWCSLPILGLAVLLIAGCGAILVGAAAGAGAVAYVRGELKATEEATLDDVVRATETALEDDLKFPIHSKTTDAISAKFTSETAAGKDITINLKKTSATLTQIRIRVDVFGDEELSRLILDKIKKRL